MLTTKRLIIFLSLSMLLFSATITAYADEAKAPQVIKITAKKFEYSPNEIKIKAGVPVVFEFTSLDRVHGFTVPDLGGIRLTIEPGKVNRITILAPKAGKYEFHCDLFCGEGHEGMSGKIIAEN